MNECVILNLNGMNFVQVRYRMENMLFLLDTGASISVIFSGSIHENERIDKSKKTKIVGVGGFTYSLGVANILFSLNNYEILHEFLVTDKFSSDIHGILGSDFFSKYGANINYETYLFSFCIFNNKINVPMISKYDSYISLPPRSEVITYCEINKSGEFVVMPEELCEGVLVAGIVVSSYNEKIAVRIVNVNEREVQIRNFKPRLQCASDFEIYNFDKTDNLVIDRIDKILDSIDMSTLNIEEKLSIQKICAKYSDVFHLEGDPLTVTNLYKQKLQLKDDAVPVYVKPYRLPHAQKSDISNHVNRMLREGTIEEAKSEWNSAILIVPKKPDSSGIKKTRLVIDYRLVNQRALRDEKFPLPCIAEILDSLSGALYFSHLDLSQGYYQLELDKASRPYTAFTTNEGQYQMKRLPMGLKVSPSIFSRLMTVAMSGLNYESCFIYLDDLIIFGNSLQNHNINLTKVLQRLRKVNLKLNPSKCDFLKKEILYLGHIISSDGISPDPEKLKAIVQYPIPQNADEAKRFVAFANYYRKFINNFAQIAQPLNELSRKGKIFVWTEKCQLSFDKLKQAITNPPLLQYPNFSENNTFILKTDASGYAIGSILCNSNDKPIAFASRVLNKAEQNYCTIEKELLAIVWSVKHFRPYLYGKKFQIFSDHRPLIYLFSMTNPSSRLTKFRLILEEYSIHYIKGSQNVNADALSRIKIESTELKEITAKVNNSVNVMTRAQTKMQNVQKQPDLINSKNERLDHPGIVELLKPPVDGIELRLVNEIDFNKKYKNKINHGYINNNIFIYDEISQIICFNQDHRSALDLGTSLRDLGNLCKKYQIPELYILKNTKNDKFIKHISRYRKELLNNGIKLNIVSNVNRVVNNEMKQLILNDFHNLPTGGHAGINRMYNNIKKRYFWSGLKKDVEDFVRRCNDCQRHKYCKINKQTMTITSTATSAFQKIFLDIVGPIKNDSLDNCYILTIQCELTKFVECYPLQNKEAYSVAKSFVENFILRYGIPQETVTDQGKEFVANVFQDSCKLLGIKTLNSTAYHHETLGALENSHKHLGAYLRIQIANHEDNWSTWVPYWCFSYNNTVHTETKYTPYELVFGKISHIPSNIANTIDPLYNFDNYPHELKYRLQVACNDARNNLISSKYKRKEQFDKNCHNIIYNIGDKVLVLNENMDTKLDCVYIGPYIVLKDSHPNILLNIKNKPTLVHKNRIKLYHE